MRTLILVAGLIAVIGMSNCQAAEHPGAGTEHPSAAIVTATSGTVAKVDSANNTITLKLADGTEKVLTVSEDAVLIKAGNDITLADIKEGDSITAEEKDGEVASITVK